MKDCKSREIEQYLVRITNRRKQTPLFLKPGKNDSFVFYIIHIRRKIVKVERLHKKELQTVIG